MASFKNLQELAVNGEAEFGEADVAPALKKAMQARRERIAEAAAEEMLSLIESTETVKRSTRDSIRRFQKEIKRGTTFLDEVDRAMAYGVKSGNFLPLLIKLGHVNASSLDEDGRSRAEVPADFRAPKK